MNGDAFATALVDKYPKLSIESAHDEACMIEFNGERVRPSMTAWAIGHGYYISYYDDVNDVYRFGRVGTEPIRATAE